MFSQMNIPKLRKEKTTNVNEIVSAGIRALYGKQKYAYKYQAV